MKVLKRSNDYIKECWNCNSKLEFTENDIFSHKPIGDSETDYIKCPICNKWNAIRYTRSR